MSQVNEIINEFMEFLYTEFKEHEFFPQINKFLQKLNYEQIDCCQFIGCLAIDIKGQLVDKQQYAELINDFINLEYSKKYRYRKYINLEDFDKFIIERLVLSKETLNLEGTEYVRVLTEEAFLKFYGSKYAGPFHDVESYEIDWKIIEDKGWSGKKNIVWVTPFKEFESVVRKSLKPEDATEVCDYLGFPRDPIATKMGSTHKHKGKTIFVYIKYPATFNAQGYQPNTTNADWQSKPLNYVSYPKGDGFGRTYSDICNHSAKEIIHCKCTVKDRGFSVHKLGTAEVKVISERTILKEIQKRFRNA